MKKNTLILIPAKKISKRCPGKNQELLEWTIDWLDSLRHRSILITDSLDMINIAKSKGMSTWFSENNSGEFSCFYEYLEYIQYSEDDFIYLPLTQPLREVDLIERILSRDITDYDFITSYCNLPDRRIFEVNDLGEFVYPSLSGRKGVFCMNQKIIDGSIYRIKTNFLKNIIKEDDQNVAFWNGKKGLIENNMPFLDIDTVEDLHKFKNLLKLIK